MMPLHCYSPKDGGFFILILCSHLFGFNKGHIHTGQQLFSQRIRLWVSFPPQAFVRDSVGGCRY